MEITNEFRNSMSEWVDLKKQLAEARKDMKILNSKEKELKKFIMGFMGSNKIDNINLKKGKVSYKSGQKTGSMTKKTVESGLDIYFNGDEVKVEGAMNCINDNRVVSDTETITLSGTK